MTFKKGLKYLFLSGDRQGPAMRSTHEIPTDHIPAEVTGHRFGHHEMKCVGNVGAFFDLAIPRQEGHNSLLKWKNTLRCLIVVHVRLFILGEKSTMYTPYLGTVR